MCICAEVVTNTIVSTFLFEQLLHCICVSKPTICCKQTLCANCIHYASVRMCRRHTVVGSCICVCVCVCVYLYVCNSCFLETATS